MAQALTVGLSLLALVAAAAVYVGERRRTDFEIARTLHHDLTSGEVALARRTLGTLRYGTEEQRASLNAADIVSHYFSLLWCFERIFYGRQALLDGKLLGRRGRRSRSVVFLDRGLTWHLQEWCGDRKELKAEIEKRAGVQLNDEQSRTGLECLCREVSRVPAKGTA